MHIDHWVHCLQVITAGVIQKVESGRKDHWSRYNLVGPLRRLSLTYRGVRALSRCDQCRVRYVRTVQAFIVLEGEAGGCL
jgi:hypothetical protein